MKIINLRMYQVRKLETLKIERGVFNTEALMLVLNKKYTKSSKEMVFKYLDAQDDDRVMARKMYTMSMLNSSAAYKSIEELIISDYSVVVDGQFAGFAMELIDSHKNLGIALEDENISFEKKLNYLTQVGSVIDKVQRVDRESFRMHFGDLNEYNFILDKFGNAKAIDLDSAYVGQDEPVNNAYYLSGNPHIVKLREKYKLTRSGNVIPSDNTDLYCYNMIVLGTLAKTSFHDKNMGTYYAYINYMKNLGVDNYLLDIFKKIYLPVNNLNPKDLLKELDPKLEKDLEFKTFQKEHKRS